MADAPKPAKKDVGTQVKKTIDGTKKAVKATLTALTAAAVGVTVGFGVAKNLPDSAPTTAALTQLGYTNIQTSYAGIFSNAARCDSEAGISPVQILTQDYLPTSFTATNRDGVAVEGLACFNYVGAKFPLGLQENIVIKATPVATVETTQQDFLERRQQTYFPKK